MREQRRWWRCGHDACGECGLGVGGALSGSSGALSLSLSLCLFLSLSLVPDTLQLKWATTLVVDHSDVLHHYQGCWSDVTECWACRECLWWQQDDRHRWW